MVNLVFLKQDLLKKEAQLAEFVANPSIQRVAKRGKFVILLRLKTRYI
jgi:hypothetical protein